MEVVHLPEMHCQGCAEKVRAVLVAIDPTIRIAVNLSDKQLQVHSDRPKQELVMALRRAGFMEAT